MGADQNYDWQGAMASALDWWRDAGADTLVEDVPFGWLSAPDTSAVELAPVATPGATAPAAPAALPDTLEAFAAWRAGPDAPDAGWRNPTPASGGATTADLMLLVDCPERGDRDTLLDGEVGRLLDRMLAAIGRSRADIVLAPVALRRPTTGRIPREIEARLGEIARHHVALAGAKRLLVLGDAATRAVLGTNAAESRGRLHALKHKDGKVTHVVASHHPRVLLDRPACKSEAWRDLLLLTEEQA